MLLSYDKNKDKYGGNMKFDNILQEINIDTGEVGHYFKNKMTPEEEEELKKKAEKEKRKRRGKRAFGSWFTSHNNKKHLEK